MTSIERKPYYKDRITKTGEFSSRTTRKLGSSKEADRKGKKSYEEAVWQKKEKFSRIEGWQQHIARV